MARFGVTERIQIPAKWAVDWLRDGKDFDSDWDIQGNTLDEIYPPGPNLSINRRVFLMCGTTGELQGALDLAINAGFRALFEGDKGYIWVFDARRKILTANKTVTVMKIFNINQYYNANNLEAQAKAHGWRLAERGGHASITLDRLRNHYIPNARNAGG